MVHMITIVSMQLICARIEELMLVHRRFLSPAAGTTSSISQLVKDYDEIVQLIHRHNRLVKDLLAQALSFLLPIFSVIFSFSAFPLDQMLKTLVVALGYSFSIPLFVLLSNAGRVSTDAAAPLVTLNAMQIRCKHITLRDKTRLLRQIKRISNQSVERIGFTYGNLKIFTRGTVVSLLIESISYTLMIQNEIFNNKQAAT